MLGNVKRYSRITPEQFTWLMQGPAVEQKRRDELVRNILSLQENVY